MHFSVLFCQPIWNFYLLNSFSRDLVLYFNCFYNIDIINSRRSYQYICDPYHPWVERQSLDVSTSFNTFFRIFQTSLVNKIAIIFVITISNPLPDSSSILKTKNVSYRVLFSLSVHYLVQVSRKTQDSFTLRVSSVPRKLWNIRL